MEPNFLILTEPVSHSFSAVEKVDLNDVDGLFFNENFFLVELQNDAEVGFCLMGDEFKLPCICCCV